MEIKRLLQVGLILAGCIAAPGWTMMINGGGSGNGIDAVGERNWLNSFLGSDAVTFTIEAGDINYFGTVANGVLAFVHKPAANHHLVLMNVVRIDHFDSLADTGRDIFDSGKSGGDNYEVPEPGVLGLLGIGLIGIVLSRRRRAA
jgi:hypothetical protein